MNMIEEKKIEEGARDYINKNGYFVKYDEDPCVDIEVAYKEGAKWAINEFLKDLWHPANEEPERNKKLLGYDIDGYSIYRWIDQESEWKDFVYNTGLQKWLYIDDLLTNEGGNE